MDTYHCPPLVALYVPGDRPDRFEKAAGSGADAVIFDLEDAVLPTRKERARQAVVDYIAGGPPCAVVVRVNGADTPWHTADLEALARYPGPLSIRLPKCESADQVDRAARLGGDRPVQTIIESAIGVERMADIAAARPTASISLGEADLRTSLGISDPDGLDWIRTRLVIAARAADLPAPMMSVWTALPDLEGLAASCRQGRTRGFMGRVAIHPKQIPAIRAAFQPTMQELKRAQSVLQALAQAGSSGSGVAVTSDGRMVDEAMKRSAETIVALSSRDA